MDLNIILIRAQIVSPVTREPLQDDSWAFCLQL